MSEDKLNKMGNLDILNLDSGKDWIITTTIPNRILRKYPVRVM
jgi:hypothetical protein